VQADLVVGGVLIPGAAAPKLVTRAMVSRMKPGAVVVDVAIDQGGCFETSHATTHADPTFVVDGVMHYCVANMPGAVARTSTFALNNATIGHALALADKGWKRAAAEDPHLRSRPERGAGPGHLPGRGRAIGLRVGGRHRVAGLTHCLSALARRLLGVPLSRRSSRVRGVRYQVQSRACMATVRPNPVTASQNPGRPMHPPSKAALPVEVAP
jgi:hypothetical protein